MAREFALSVVAPDRAVVETTASSVIAPGLDGYFGILAGHVPVVAALRPGLLEYVDSANNRCHVYVGGGFVQVDESKVTVLADEARATTEIDLAESQAMLDEARRALRGEESTMSKDDAVLAIERASARIKASKIK